MVVVGGSGDRGLAVGLGSAVGLGLKMGLGLGDFASGDLGLGDLCFALAGCRALAACWAFFGGPCFWVAIEPQEPKEPRLRGMRRKVMGKGDMKTSGNKVPYYRNGPGKAHEAAL